MEVIDRKFRFVAVNPCNNHVYTEENGIVFAAKDKALPEALRAYYKECRRLHCDSSHLESVNLLIERIVRFQANVECRIPDTDTPCEINRCIGGKMDQHNISQPAVQADAHSRCPECGGIIGSYSLTCNSGQHTRTA